MFRISLLAFYCLPYKIREFIPKNHHLELSTAHLVLRDVFGTRFRQVHMAVELRILVSSCPL